MKKIILAAALLLTLATTISSCGASRKTGCPAVAQQIESKYIAELHELI